MADYATNFIAQAVREGLSARQGLIRFREAGGAIGNETWFRAYASVIASLSARAAVEIAPLGRRPTSEEISTWATARQRGYLYQIEVQVRPRGTSEVFTTWHSYRSSRLVPFADALGGSLDALADDLDAYGEVVLGGVVTGVFEMVPEGA